MDAAPRTDAIVARDTDREPSENDASPDIIGSLDGDEDAVDDPGDVASDASTGPLPATDAVDAQTSVDADADERLEDAEENDVEDIDAPPTDIAHETTVDVVGVPAHCLNRVLDDDEVRTDCGGSCAPCADRRVVRVGASAVDPAVFGDSCVSMVFEGAHGPSAEDFELGDVVAVGEPTPRLCIVDRITPIANGVVIGGYDGTLADAFSRGGSFVGGEVVWPVEQDLLEFGVSAEEKSEWSRSFEFGAELSATSRNFFASPNELQVFGDLSWTGTLTPSASYSWANGLEELSLLVESELQGRIGLRVSSTVSLADTSFGVQRIMSPAIYPLTLGIIPATMQLGVDIIPRVQLDGEFEMTGAYEVDFSTVSGIAYTRGEPWRFVYDSPTSGRFVGPETRVAVNASVEVAIRPVFELRALNAAGPYVSLGPTAGVEVDYDFVSRRWTAALTACLTANAGGVFRIFGRARLVDLPDLRACVASRVIAQGCEDDCMRGQDRCVGDAARQFCGEALDGDTCSEWVTAPCATGETCRTGTCMELCECDGGACCSDGCHFDGPATVCGGSEERLCGVSSSCGDAVFSRSRERFCDGESAACIGAWGSWSDESPVTACADNQRCTESASTAWCAVDSSCDAPEPECTTGACCADGYFRAEGTLCDDEAAERFTCTGSTCGGSVMRETRTRVCSGDTSGCNGALSGWQPAGIVERCGDAEVCSAGDGRCRTSSACEPEPSSCPVGAPAGAECDVVMAFNERLPSRSFSTGGVELATVPIESGVWSPGSSQAGTAEASGGVLRVDWTTASLTRTGRIQLTWVMGESPVQAAYVRYRCAVGNTLAVFSGTGPGSFPACTGGWQVATVPNPWFLNAWVETSTVPGWAEFDWVVVDL